MEVTEDSRPTSHDPQKSDRNWRPVTLDFGSFDKDDINDLREGEGKIFKRITKTIATLQKEGQLSENIQLVIAVTKKKKKKKKRKGLFG